MATKDRITLSLNAVPISPAPTFVREQFFLAAAASQPRAFQKPPRQHFS